MVSVWRFSLWWRNKTAGIQTERLVGTPAEKPVTVLNHLGRLVSRPVYLGPIVHDHVHQSARHALNYWL